MQSQATALYQLRCIASLHQPQATQGCCTGSLHIATRIALCVPPPAVTGDDAASIVLFVPDAWCIQCEPSRTRRQLTVATENNTRPTHARLNSASIDSRVSSVPGKPRSVSPNRLTRAEARVFAVSCPAFKWRRVQGQNQVIGTRI